MKDTTTVDSPKEWPGAFAAYKLSRDSVRKNLGPLVLLILLLGAISFALTFIAGSIFKGNTADIVKQLVSLLFGTYASVIMVSAYLSSARQKRIDFDAVTIVSPSLFWRMLFLNLLTILSVIGGLVLLIVPGIIIGMRLSAAQYYLVDQNLGVLEAYKASWHATKGNIGKVWGMVGVSFLMFLPVFTLIGIIATVYLLFMYSAVKAFFYLYLAKSQ